MTILELEQHIASIVANLRAKGYVNIDVNLAHWGDWSPPTWHGTVSVRYETYSLSRKFCDVTDVNVLVVLGAMQRAALGVDRYISSDKLAEACAPWFDVAQTQESESAS